MNTSFDKFIEDGKHRLDNITVHELKHRLAELELLGMADYKVLMFVDEDSDDVAPIASLWFDGNTVMIST
jgi:hypothetical protein